MSKPKAYKKRDSKYMALGVFFILIIVAVAVGAGLLIVDPSRGVDSQTLCPMSGPKGHVVLLVDKTDPLNYTQKEAFRQFINEFGNEMVLEGELCSIFALGDDYRASPEPLFEMCSPGNGEGKSFVTENPAKIKKQFDKKFIEPMHSVTKSLFSDKPAEHSPLLEMMQMVSINGFRKAAVKGPKRLIIVSDMLHNTDDYSLYRDSMDFEALKKTDYFQRVRTDLDGVKIELRYLMHSPSLQTRKNVEFWEGYFQDINGEIVSVKPWEG